MRTVRQWNFIGVSEIAHSYVIQTYVQQPRPRQKIKDIT